MNPILVLGAKVTEGHVSAILNTRLAKTVDIAVMKPGVSIIVSGRGEAAAMAGYLAAHGVDDVIEEPYATSTNENLEYAQRLFPTTKSWTVITSDFHVWRTYLWAWHLGIRVHVIGATTPESWRSQMLARECLALPHSAIRVAWRKIRKALNSSI